MTNSERPMVYIPHLVTKYDKTRDRVIPSMDFTPAAKYGELNLILDDDFNPLFFQRTIEQIKWALVNFRDCDYFLPVGDPAIIGACCSIIVEKFGVLNILKWDKKTQSYIHLRGEF